MCRSHYAKQYLRPSLNQAQQKYRQSERGKETDERYGRSTKGRDRQARYREQQRELRQQELERKRRAEVEWYEQQIEGMPADRQQIFRDLLGI